MLKLIEKGITGLSQASIWILSFAAIGLLFLIFYEEGLTGVWSTLTVDVVNVLGKFVMVMIIFFTITGSINHLQKRHPEKFNKIIAGDYGTVAMVVLAATMPGMAGGKQIQDAWNTPGVDRARVLLCLAAAMGMSITMFMFRSKFIGAELTLIWAAMATGLLLQIWVIGKCKPWAWFT